MNQSIINLLKTENFKPEKQPEYNIDSDLSVSFHFKNSIFEIFNIQLT